MGGSSVDKGNENLCKKKCEREEVGKHTIALLFVVVVALFVVDESAGRKKKENC